MRTAHAPTSNRHSRSCHQKPQSFAVRPGNERQPGQHHAPGDRRLVRAGGARGSAGVLHRAWRTCWRSCPASRSRLHRRLHPVGAAGLCAEQLLPPAGAVTVLGGPHARCYPEDASKYFDYVLGFTDREVVAEVCGSARRTGRVGRLHRRRPAAAASCRRWRSAGSSWRRRWRRRPTIKIVPMIGSLGCPYTCSFCIDSTVDYQPLGFEPAAARTSRSCSPRSRDPIVGWHDPNFGVRFDDYMEAIEAAVPPGAHPAHRREQPVAAVGAAPQAAAEERLPGHPARHRVVVRSGQQVEDPPDGDGQGPAGGRAREHDPALHPLHPDQLRPGPRRRQGAGAVRADQEVHRPGARRVSGLLAAVGVRPGGADEPGVPARRPGAAVPVSLPEQQPRDERPAQELLLARVLRPSGGRHPLLVLLAGDRAAAPRHGRGNPQVDERGARGVIGGVWPDPLSRRRSGGCSTPTGRCAEFMEGESDRLPEFYAARIRKELGPLYEYLPAGRAVCTIPTRTCTPPPSLPSTHRCSSADQ